MNRLPLNFACWDYDRMRPLMDGRVQVDGVALNFLNLLRCLYHRIVCLYRSRIVLLLQSRCIHLDFLGIPVFILMPIVVLKRQKI